MKKTVPLEPIDRSEITPEPVYLNRRQFMRGAATLGGAALLAACGPLSAASPQPTPTGLQAGAAADELGSPLTPYEAVTTYNNFYEFSESKEAVAKLSQNFDTAGWQVEVYGLVEQPRTFSMEEVLKTFKQEERIYRLRCVEGWSMVIPWTGFPLGRLLEQVRPTAEAAYVRFQTLYDPAKFPNQDSPFYSWPYQEGLRLDEAQNDLALLATGLYGKPLPAQDGAPIRLVVPWKYGFKSIKSIVKIELVKDQPMTLWSTAAANEYGFYANVNPNVPHPRWSQASERRIGETKRRDTLLFNGYEAQVAHLYEGMDLEKNY